jgi:phosphatidylserine/phosphatidylglycerophosphate/cardiolipin synthase-like enzyme
VHDLIADARHSVDIAALQPVPDTRFLAALRAGLAVLAASGRPIAVRLLVGQYPPDGADAAALLSSLTSGLRDAPGAQLTISVAAMRSCTSVEACRSFSWPHAKFIVIDGHEVLVGGHNFWSEDYFVDKPVHDLSLRARGPAAASASRFADRLWRFVCDNLDRKPAVQLTSYTSAGSVASAPCPLSMANPVSGGDGQGGTSMLAVGRLGAGITKDFANQSELARDLMFGAARHTIRMSQQDIGFMLGRSDVLFPESTLDRLIDFMEQRGGHVYIVLSNRGAAGNSGLSYSNDVTYATFARHMRDLVQKRIDARDPKARYEIRRGPDPINAMLCSQVHLAPFRTPLGRTALPSPTTPSSGWSTISFSTSARTTSIQSIFRSSATSSTIERRPRSCSMLTGTRCGNGRGRPRSPATVSSAASFAKHREGG